MFFHFYLTLKEGPYFGLTIMFFALTKHFCQLGKCKKGISLVSFVHHLC